MHDIFSLPPEGYPEELLPIRQEILARTQAGHIDSAFEMYQFELSRLQELGIAVFALPREHFVLEHRLGQLDFATEQAAVEQTIEQLDQLKLAAGFPPERIADPLGAGKPADLRELEAQMERSAQGGDIPQSLELSKRWLQLMRHYGYPLPDDEEAVELYDTALAQEQALNRQIPTEYLATMRALAMALYHGDIDEAMVQHEKQLVQAVELEIPVPRLTREYFELQHRISQAARQNDQTELARLQQELAALQPQGSQGLEMFEDPSGVMGLPPAYVELSRATSAAFQRGDTAAAVSLSRQMQEMLESSGSIFNIMNIIENGSE